MIQIETILDILVKGFVIGIVVSAPLGPVGVLCIQRTLNKGRWYGFVTGLGASLSDIAYALLTGYGMSFVFDYINKNIFYLQLLGSIMLLAFGIYTFRSNPVQSIRPVSANKGSYFHNFITAFAISWQERPSKYNPKIFASNSDNCFRVLSSASATRSRSMISSSGSAEEARRAPNG